jgi:hypothetical protein
MTNPGDDRDELVEAVAGAYRGRDPQGGLRWHPGFYDLDDEGRVAAFDAARRSRVMEAALDPEGLSTTARAVLKRITG